MPFTVAFVAQVGRNSVGDWTARPKIESIVAKYGGQMQGGVGNSVDPLKAVFAVKENAVHAARDAWYLDDVEFAKVLEADRIASAAVQESVSAGIPADIVETLIGRVAEGATTAFDAVAILLGQKPYTEIPTMAGAGADCCGDPRPLVAPGEPNPATATA